MEEEFRSIVGYEGKYEISNFGRVKSFEEMKKLPEGEQQLIMDKCKNLRDIYKVANYSCIYKVGAKTLGESTGLPIRKAKLLIKAYWDRNWSIRQLPKDMTTKIVDEQMWLLNPVNGFWYSIRNEKDIFSTLNQGTGAYVFDCWLKYMMMEGVIPFLQYHDEKLTLVKREKGAREKHRNIINRSMDKVNDALKLNVEISVDVQFGLNYGQVH